MPSRRTLWGLAFAALALTVGPGTGTPLLHAQATPADTASVLLSTAQAFEAEEDWRVAAALYRHIVERYPGTSAAAEAALRLSQGVEDGESSGSTEIQVWATTYGLWLGVAIPGAFGADEPEPYGLGLLVGGPAGFFTGRAFARSRQLSVGQARAITLGGTWGTWQGFGWREVFDFGEGDVVCDPFNCYGSSDTSEETFAAMLLGGAVGITTGAILARKPITNATATAANFGSLYGTWVGFGLGFLMDLDEGDDDGLLAATLLGGNAGLVTGAVLAPRLGWTRSRWRLVSAGALLGALSGAGIDLLVQPDDENVAIAIPLVASAIGLGIGVRSTRDDGVAMTPDEPEIPALLSLADGSLSLGSPVPTPILRQVHRPNRSSLEPALAFTLFRAEFR